jgi:hypothetical protein
MPALIEDYFQAQLNLLASLPMVENQQVNLEKRAETVGFIRGDIEFKDGSRLHYRELVDLRQPMRLIMYAYNYQKLNGSLAFRYDNTPHHMNVNTFPYHQHTGEGKIIAAQAPDLEKVLREIEMLIKPEEAAS